MNKNLDVRGSFEHIRRIFFLLVQNFILLFVFLFSNRRILSPATVTSSKAPLRASARARSPIIHIQFRRQNNPLARSRSPTPVLTPLSVSSSSLHPLVVPKQRDASARASFHCGRRAFPATFVRPRQGRYREAKLSLYCRCKIAYSFRLFR